MKYESETNPFYLTPRWQRKRAAILRRDKYLCQECKRYGRFRDAKTVHHIKHLEDAPEDTVVVNRFDAELVNRIEINLEADDIEIVPSELSWIKHNKMHPEKGIQGPRKYTMTGNAYGNRGRRAKN